MIHIGINRLSTYTDEKLMHLFQLGQTMAFEIIYNRYGTPILHYFFRMFNGNGEQAQDFLQDLFFKLIDKKNTYDPNQKFSSWIYSIAANMCKNEYRRIQNKNVAYNNFLYGLNNESHNLTENRIHDKIVAETIWKEIEEISDVQKSAFILRFKNGFSLKEIAEIMECSEGTVKSRLYYTVKKISKRLSTKEYKERE